MILTCFHRFLIITYIIIVCTNVTIYFKFTLSGITQHPANDTYCVGSNAVLSCIVFDNSTADVADTTNWFDINTRAAVSFSMISNSRDGDVVTSVLTIESVSLNNNGTGYFCVPSFVIGSYAGVLSVAG